MLALSQVLLELGSAWLDFDQPRPAISVLKNALGFAHAAHLPQREAECLTLLGQSYRLIQQPRLAPTCFEQVHQVLADLDANASLGQLWNQQGFAHAQMEAYTSAREDYTQALSLARVVGDQQLETEALRNLGNLCASDLDEWSNYTIDGDWSMSQSGKLSGEAWLLETGDKR